MKKSQPKNGKKTGTRKYTRTTPVGRVVRNVTRALDNLNNALRRLRSWEYAKEGKVDEAAAKLGAAQVAITGELEGNLSELMDWTPPKKSMAISFEVGDEVLIRNRHMDKYAEIYEKKVLANLTVTKVLSSGEIAVRFGDKPPFIVSKSHIEKRAEA
jgi:hypothetical protein